MRRRLRATGVLLCFALPLASQTPYSIVSGFVLTAGEGGPLQSARVDALNTSTAVLESTTSDAQGRFTLPLLSPGIYRVTASAPSYQDRVIDQLEVSVGGHLDVRFELWKLSDPWHAATRRTITMPKSQAVSPFFGPDINLARSDSFAPPSASGTLLDSARSYVVDRELIAALPLAGRDVYATLAVQPGVTSGTTTARGLGMSVNGQRPTSTEFLLDGVENNNYLTTGPLVAPIPEIVQEYRLSTANFPAPYGGATGLVANAVTIGGGAQWHGLGYVYVRNMALTAADPQRKAECGAEPAELCVPLAPLHELETGLRLSGLIPHTRLILTAAGDVFRYRSAGKPQSLRIPAAPMFERLAATPTSQAAAWLLSSGLPVYPSTELTTVVPLAPAVLQYRVNWLGRLDYAVGAHRLFGRATHSRSDQPQFFWSPYPVYGMPLVRSSLLAAAGDTWLPRSWFANEARAAAGAASMRLERTPGVPDLESEDFTVLPGSPTASGVRYRARHTEAVDNITWMFGRHIFRGGGSILDRGMHGAIPFQVDPYYLFTTAKDFAKLNPIQYRISVDRIASQSDSFQPYQPSRQFTAVQGAFFLQDTIRVGERLTFTAGLRLENFGSIRNIGPIQDSVLSMGKGETLERRVGTSTLSLSRNPAFAAEWNAAPRIGVAWQSRSGTTVRLGYGLYYDRPFDNMWLVVDVNAAALAQVQLFPPPDPDPRLSLPVPPISQDDISHTLPRVTWIAPDLHAPRVQSLLLAVNRPLPRGISVEFTAAANYGRRLITSNIVNRQFTTKDFDSVGRSQTQLPDIVYRANQGVSKHVEWSAIVRHRTASSYVQAGYTLSQSFDNQSDALSGDFDYAFTGLNPFPTAPRSTFTQQFDSRPDWARSDFDQRHNFVALGYWRLPERQTAGALRALLRGWQACGLVAVRSGQPFSVYGRDGFSTLRNNRANLVRPDAYYIHGEAPGGGVQLLDLEAFRDSPGVLGNTGRNAFRGPGLISADLSVSRTIEAGERLRLTLRADAFNFLNHPNLGQPDNFYGGATFGVAPYGRRETTNGFPGQIPFVESPRSIQLMLRLAF